MPGNSLSEPKRRSHTVKILADDVRTETRRYDACGGLSVADGRQ